MDTMYANLSRYVCGRRLPFILVENEFSDLALKNDYADWTDWCIVHNSGVKVKSICLWRLSWSSNELDANFLAENKLRKKKHQSK